MQDESSARLFEALTLADELGDDRIRAAVLHGLSSIYEAQGAYEQMLESTMRTLAVAEVLQDRLLLLRTYSAIGLTYAHLHRPEEGMPWLHKGLAMIDDDTQPFIKTFLKMNLMYLHRRSGNLEEAVALAEEYEDRLAGLPAQHAAVLYVDIAEIYLEVGDLDRAAEMLQHADRVSDPDWMKAHLLSYYLALAELQEARGEPAHALETLRQHMELERELRGRQARTRLVAIERHFAAELAAKTDEVHHLRTVELVDKNAQLSDLIRRNEEILEVVVNDLRNPLAATKLLTQVLLADLSDAKAIEMVQSINSATVEMSHAVTRLLVSQGTDSTVTNTTITLDLDDDVKDAVSSHSQTPLD